MSERMKLQFPRQTRSLEAERLAPERAHLLWLGYVEARRVGKSAIVFSPLIKLGTLLNVQGRCPSRNVTFQAAKAQTLPLPRFDQFKSVP
jgi:hypothetical protein